MKRYRNLGLAAIFVLALIGLSLAKSGMLTGRGGATQPSEPQPNAAAPQVAKSERSSVDDAQKIQRLQSIIPQSPTVATRQVIDIMREAAETRRDEVLPLLIKALAFNIDPNNQNEFMTGDMLLPAVQLIKEYYGEKAAEPLYSEGLSSTQKWYRNRIAVAVRAILSPDVIQKMNAKFVQGNYHAEDFALALATENVELFLARSDAQNLDKLDELMKARRKGKS